MPCQCFSYKVLLFQLEEQTSFSHSFSWAAIDKRIHHWSYSFPVDTKGVAGISNTNVAQLSLPAEMKQTKTTCKAFWKTNRLLLAHYSVLPFSVLAPSQSKMTGKQVRGLADAGRRALRVTRREMLHPCHRNKQTQACSSQLVPQELLTRRTQYNGLFCALMDLLNGDGKHANMAVNLYQRTALCMNASLCLLLWQPSVYCNQLSDFNHFVFNWILIQQSTSICFLFMSFVCLFFTF